MKIERVGEPEMRRKRRPIIRVTRHPMTPEEERAFREALDLLIMEVADAEINRRSNHARQPIEGTQNDLRTSLQHAGSGKQCDAATSDGARQVLPRSPDGLRRQI